MRLHLTEIIWLYPGELRPLWTWEPLHSFSGNLCTLFGAVLTPWTLYGRSHSSSSSSGTLPFLLEFSLGRGRCVHWLVQFGLAPWVVSYISAPAAWNFGLGITSLGRCGDCGHLYVWYASPPPPHLELNPRTGEQGMTFSSLSSVQCIYSPTPHLKVYESQYCWI